MPGKLRNLLVESPNSVGARARLRRWEMFRHAFPDIEDMRILDLGGTAQAWERSPVRPRAVTVLNLFDTADSGLPWISSVRGDACEAAAVLNASGIGGRYDLVYSNSLIEHLGGHDRRQAFAAQVAALADRHWVQTPYRYFPLEPHWLFPGMQFLPTVVRTGIAQHWPLVHTKPANRAVACDEVLSTELLGVGDLRFYFPASAILRERILGLTKSIIAVA